MWGHHIIIEGPVKLFAGSFCYSRVILLKKKITKNKVYENQEFNFSCCFCNRICCL